MFGKKRFLISLMAASLLAAAGCTNDFLDDGSSADVVIEVAALTNPPVTAQQAEGGVGCTLEVVDWVATIANQPKNELAGGESIPFNDVVMFTVTISYSWVSGGISTPTRVVGLGNVTIPAAGTNDVTFAPIAFDDLTLATLGRTCDLTLTFEARTVEGTRITKTVQRQLFVEACVGG
jgi:hypothetical protein